MQITIDIKDPSIINRLKEEFHTEDITEALDKLLHRFKYKDEYKIASDISNSLKDLNDRKTRDIKELLDEL